MYDFRYYLMYVFNAARIVFIAGLVYINGRIAFQILFPTIYLNVHQDTTNLHINFEFSICIKIKVQFDCDLNILKFRLSMCQYRNPNIHRGIRFLLPVSMSSNAR